jgi:hypothetical protein
LVTRVATRTLYFTLLRPLKALPKRSLACGVVLFAAQDVKGEQDAGVPLAVDQDAGAPIETNGTLTETPPDEPPLPPFDSTPQNSAVNSSDAALPGFDAVPSSHTPFETTPEAVTWDSGGMLGAEARGFWPDARTDTNDVDVQLASELFISLEHGRFDERVRVFGRVDALDHARRAVYLEEAWARLRVGFLGLRHGFDTLSFTVMDAFRVLDTFNARDLDTDLLNPRKLGEPLAALDVVITRSTTLSAFYMPFVVQPRFTSPFSRLHFAPLGVDLAPAFLITNSYGRHTEDLVQPQAALRLRHAFSKLDLTASVIHHVDRTQPFIVADARTLAPARLHQMVTQSGGSANAVIESFVLRLPLLLAHRS